MSNDIDIEVLEDDSLDMDTDEVLVSGGSGTTNYNFLTNKPKINDVTLTGNKSLSDLGITSAIADEVEDYVEEHKSELKGDKGDTGNAGANGVSCTHSWNGTVLTVTSASGTSSADLKGAKGDQGDSYTITSADYNEIAIIVYDMFTDAESVSV